MRNALILILLAAAPAYAEGNYERLLQEAYAEQTTSRPNDEPDARFNRAYNILAKAAQLEPGRWEAFLQRGLNRCEVAVVNYSTLQSTLAYLRAQGATYRDLDAKRQGGLQFIEICVQDAAHDFHVMERNMRLMGQFDPQLKRLTQAMLLYSRRQFLKGPRGGHGAIQILKELGDSGYKQALCSEYIARSYNELGVEEFTKEKFRDAQVHWEEALKWAVDSRYARTILTNRAGGYEMDHEFGKAEKVLRELISLEPKRAIHWKNLGLVIGFQNRLKEALYCYARARELCGPVDHPQSIARWHGNAWMRAAIIHGNLLEEDGDVKLAWRLLLEYRSLFGDDYNFSLWFGDFASNHGQYDLAWKYLEHARDLQPQCTIAYQSLLLIAPRVGGERDVVRARIKKAERELDSARAKYNLREESPDVKRICGGLQDLADGTGIAGPSKRLDPDPLAEWAPDKAPPWVLAAAGKRQAFVPWDPADGPEKPVGTGEEEPEESSSVEAHITPNGTIYVVVIAGLLVLVFLLLFRRRRAAA